MARCWWGAGPAGLDAKAVLGSLRESWGDPFVGKRGANLPKEAWKAISRAVVGAAYQRASQAVLTLFLPRLDIAVISPSQK